MSEIAVILASHGQFAKYAMESAQMIVGKQENFATLSIEYGMDLMDAKKELSEIYSNLNHVNGTVILVDIFGGTPSNASSSLLLEKENILLISGVNLGMILELLLNRDRTIEELAQLLETNYAAGFTNITKKMKEMSELEDVNQNL